MSFFRILGQWPVARQVAQGDVTGLDGTAMSDRSRNLGPRTATADKVVKSICPYCAVGCGQDVHVKDGKILDIEGDADSPISRGRLCPKGSATFQLVTGTHRLDRVLYRRPGSRSWEVIGLNEATELVAQRLKEARDETWEEKDEEGNAVSRTLGVAHLGGATLDNEENYLLKKLYTSLGVVQVENQARI